MQLVCAECHACVLVLLNCICTQQHETHHAGKNWVHTSSCAGRPKMVEADAYAIGRTAEVNVVTAAR